MLTKEQSEAAERAALERDLAEYASARDRMEAAEPFTEEFARAWRDLEAVKNRRGGMPPDRRSA